MCIVEDESVSIYKSNCVLFANNQAINSLSSNVIYYLVIKLVISLYSLINRIILL